MSAFDWIEKQFSESEIISKKERLLELKVKRHYLNKKIDASIELTRALEAQLDLVHAKEDALIWGKV